ncbi:MAG: hypothetical protein LC624_11215, partial [Halobacteriales archaeon]|nr:hypothetical protein [Halobacteriales archaeon]
MPRAALALVLLALLLAGCATPAKPQEQAAPAAGAPQQAGFVSPADTANATSGDGQGAFAKSLDEKFHTHNYWGSALEKTLLDADVPSSALLPSPTPGNLARGFGAFGRGIGLTPFDLPEGSIVPPEANRLTVAIAWAQSPTITGLSLAYANASSRQLHVLPQLPEGGGTYDIACELTSNDIPHTTVSKWRFVLLPQQGPPLPGGPFGGAPGVFNGTAHVTVKAYRNDTLYLAPPHKDSWGANTSLLLYDGGQAAHQTAAVFSLDDALAAPTILQGGDASDGFGDLPLANGSLVVPHTGVLTAVLTWHNNSTAPNPDDLHPELLYAPANQRGLRVPATATRDGERITYTIAVDPKAWDSPYNPASQWAFV